MMQRTLWMVLTALCFVCAGCTGTTDEDRMHTAIELAPVHLDSDQVTLTMQQVSCGVDRDLWEAPEKGSGRSIARLNKAGRDLGFTDDVSIDDHSYTMPYTQIRGDFLLVYAGMVDVKDGPERGLKTAQVRIRAKIPNDCFMGGLPVMGIQKGQFKEDAPVAIVFTPGDDEWHLERMTH